MGRDESASTNVWDEQPAAKHCADGEGVLGSNGGQDMLFGLSDGKTNETFGSLEKAVAAAQKWYKNRETERVQLPPWNYQIADIFALNTAIKDYEARLAEALGYRDVYGPGNQLIEAAAFQAGLRLHAYETGLRAGLGKAARRAPAQAQKQ